MTTVLLASLLLFRGCCCNFSRNPCTCVPFPRTIHISADTSNARNVARGLFASVLTSPIQLLLDEPGHSVPLPQATLDSACKAMCAGSYMPMTARMTSLRFVLPRLKSSRFLVFLVRRCRVAGVQGSGQEDNSGHFVRVVGESGYRVRQSESK